MIRPFSLFALAASSLLVNAEDLTVQPSRFERSIELDSTALPLQAAEIRIAPKVHLDFIVEKVLPQGSKVKKGDKLIWIDTEKLDSAILDLEKSRAIDALTLAQLEQELVELQLTSERDLRQAEISFERAKQDHEYFNNIELPLLTKEYDLQRKKASWYLDNANEELTQLLKMYASDGLTEDTEEIIVKRSKNDVERAKVEVEKAQQDATRGIEVIIPRKKLDANIAFESAKQNWQFTREKIERQIKLKQASVAKARLDDANKQMFFDHLKNDRKLAEITAPHDGILYYGEFKDGIWNSTNGQKCLFPGSKLITHTPILSVVPESAPLQLHAMTDTATAAELKSGQKGLAHLPTNALQCFPADISTVASTPNIQNQRDVLITPQPTENTQLFPGSKVKVKLTTYVKEDAISIPTKALQLQPDGTHAVSLKMADGKTSLTPVTLGQISKDNVEILTGLNAGQVIVYDK